MGCCGCDNRTSATAGGIVALIQSLVSFILICVNLGIFSGDIAVKTPEQMYFRYVLRSAQNSIMALLVIALLLHIGWIASSILMLVGNTKNLAWAVRQWVVTTSIMIICDIIFPIVLIALTVKAIVDSITEDIKGVTANPLLGRITLNNWVGTQYNLGGPYSVLVFALTRGGFVTWIVNICFCVFVSRRAQEILHPPQSGFVIAPPAQFGIAYPALVQIQQQGYIQPQPYMQPQQQGYMQPQQQGYMQPQSQGYMQQQPQHQGHPGNPPPQYGNPEEKY